MKKKFGLFALVLGLMLCASLFLFAACAGEEEDDSTDTPVAISVTVNGEGQTSGATINGDTEDVYTISASVSSGSNVTIAYVVGDGAVESFTGNSFAPDAAGTYVFTFKAEEAADFTLTFEITAAQTPAVPVITASANKTAITAGEQVVLNWSATESAQVTVTYKKDGESASVLQPESGVAFTISEAGVYVFTFAAEGAQPVEVTITVTAKHTHTYGAWTVTAPTADTAGQAVQTCTGCESSEEGHTQTVTLPALNSDEAKTAYTSAVTTIATCTTKEVTTYVFQENNAITFDITGAVSYEQKAHKNLTYVAAVEPTCTAAGKIAHAYCSDCGKYYTVTGDADDFTIGNEITDGAAGLTGDPATNHSYVWAVKAGDEPFVEKAGTATGTCSCGSTTTRELPAMTDENANQDVTTPTVGKYSFNFTQQGSCTQETITEITYKFEDGVTVTFTLKQPPFEHSYSKVEVEYDAATMDTAWGAKAYCDLGCGASVEVDNIPAVVISDESVWVWDEEGDHKLPTCGEGGYATYYYSGLELSDGTPIKVYVTNVPLPATGEHSYGKPVYSGSTVTVTCEDCKTASVSATVTIGGDGATGNTVLAAENFAFNAETNVFTVTLPENEFEKDGSTFSGWLVGEETKQVGESVTVAADGALTITAQWTEITKPTITARASATEIYVGGQVTLTWSLVGGEGEVTVTYTKNDVAADTLKPVTGEAFAINEVGVYVFTFKAAEADDVTVTVTVKEKPVISLTVDEESMENGGKYPADICVETQISYVAAVTGGGAVSASYKVDSGEDVSLEESGNFTFTKVGTYVFTITADGADTFTYTVKVVAHSGTYKYSAEKGAVVFTCGTCQKTIDCEITGLTVTGDPASAYVVDNGNGTYTAYGFTVEAIYKEVDGNTVTDIFILLDDEKLVATVAPIGGYKNATVTFTYNDEKIGATENSRYAVYTVAKEAATDTQTFTGFQAKQVELNTTAGEFEYRFTLNNVQTSGSKVYEYWLIAFTSGDLGVSAVHLDAVLRADDYLLGGWGQGGAGITVDIKSHFSRENIAAESTDILDDGTMDFVVTRTFVTDHYEITVSVSNGSVTYSYTLVEPEGIGNTMTVALGGENCTYTYSDVLFTSQSPVRTWNGTVNDAQYTAALTSTPIVNNDVDGAWNNGTTSDVLLEVGEIAILTWENHDDKNYYDFFVEMNFNPGVAGSGQYLDLSYDDAWVAEWEESAGPDEPSHETTAGTPLDEGTTDAGYGSYEAVICRVGTTVTMTVTFTPASDSSVQEGWTREAVFTNCPETIGYLKIALNPQFLTNIVAYVGTLTSV